MKISYFALCPSVNSFIHFTTNYKIRPCVYPQFMWAEPASQSWSIYFLFLFSEKHSISIRYSPYDWKSISQLNQRIIQHSLSQTVSNRYTCPVTGTTVALSVSERESLKFSLCDFSSVIDSRRVLWLWFLSKKNIRKSFKCSWNRTPSQLTVNENLCKSNNK